MPKAVPGLDFGTTNSTIGLCPPNGPPRLLPVENGNLTIPSALFFSLEDGGTYFGRAAVGEYIEGAEGRFMRALKSILGSSLMGETTQVGRKRMTFQDLIGRFLRHLRDKYAEVTGEEPEAVVLGRPVHFVDGDAAADRTAQDQLAAAARAQGFHHIEFQFEPVAAALYFERSVKSEQLALVVDVGGGTSDFSVVRLSPERARNVDRRQDILASTGVHVGGTDFDRMLSLSQVMPLLGMGSQTADHKRLMPNWYFAEMATWHRINTLYTPKILRHIRELKNEAAEPEKLERFEHLLLHRSGHRLAGAVEAAKIGLSDVENATIRLKEGSLLLKTSVGRREFERATAGLVEQITASIADGLAQAGVAPEDIETVILTGGGAQTPIVRTAATAPFPRANIVQSDAFGSVGLGLTMDAARRFA